MHYFVSARRSGIFCDNETSKTKKGERITAPPVMLLKWNQQESHLQLPSNKKWEFQLETPVFDPGTDRRFNRKRNIIFLLKGVVGRLRYKTAKVPHRFHMHGLCRARVQPHTGSYLTLLKKHGPLWIQADCVPKRSLWISDSKKGLIRIPTKGKH